jgi:hypothetical protein
MSTQEDREHDEREEYGWANPLDSFARTSAIIADQFAPVDWAVDDALESRARDILAAAGMDFGQDGDERSPLTINETLAAVVEALTS